MVQVRRPDGKLVEVKNDFRECVILRLRDAVGYDIEYLTYVVLPADHGPGKLKLLDRQTGSGSCQAFLEGPQEELRISLDSETGTDLLRLESITKEEMKLKAGIPADCGERWNKGVWTLQRQ